MTAIMSQIMDKYQELAPKGIINAIEQAASKTGVDFSFLMEKAAAESNFDPSSKAETSSATGLFQFIESTWLNMVKKHGPKYGLTSLANKIEMKNGKLCVENCDDKQAILNLRKNPAIASLMAGEFSSDNKEHLEKHTDKPVGATELYFAHFMGASGATHFLNARAENGDRRAADLFPKEARANKGVFFNPKTGQARSLNEVYDFFSQKFTSTKTAQLETGTTPSSALPPPYTPAEAGSIPLAPVHNVIPPHTPMTLAQALLSFDTEQNPLSKVSSNPSGFFNTQFSIESILLMAQMNQSSHLPYSS